MKRLRYIFWGLTAVLLFTACGSGDAPTPTPFAVLSTSTPNIGAAQPLPVAFEDLISNPIAYEGARIQLSGRYQKVPLQICDGEIFLSPATWTLVNGNMIAPLSGFDDQIEALLPEEITMIVNGIWRRWRGPIGCGKDAVTRDIWYLDVREIVEPNPLVRVTLTPSGVEVAEGGQPPGTEQTSTPPDEGEPVVATETSGAGGLGPSSTPRPTLTPNPGSSVATPTSIPSATPSDDDSDDGASTTPSSTAVSGNNPTPTITPTPPPGSTAVPTATPEQSLASPTPENSQNGTLLSDDLGFGTLASGTIHQWNINLEAGTAVTITVAMEASANPSITLISPSDEMLVNTQNLSPAGQFEIVGNLPVPQSGTYELLIHSDTTSTADYMVNFYDSQSLPLLSFEGFFEDDVTTTETIEVDTDDYWVFYLEQDDVITLTVDPNDAQADLFISLWHKDGLDPNAESDEDIGETEIIEDYVAPHTGLFVLQIGEWDFAQAPYSLTFERQ